MTTPVPPDELEQRLIADINRRGPITFEAFMQAALYDEYHGYYPTRRRRPGTTPVGTDGDYFTSPVTHPAFGALLALQLRQMWQRLGSPGELTVVEMGAGEGVLGSDIVEYAERELPDFAPVIRYVATDPVPPAVAEPPAGSATRPKLEAGSLPMAPPVGEVSELPSRVLGCVISNELLDAFPVNRFIIDGGRVCEIFVGYEDGAFVEVIDDVSDLEIEARVASFVGSFPDSYRGEVNLGLSGWADAVSATLERGYVITVDYGYDRPDLYTPTRPEGSLRCYYQHTLGQDPLRRIGKQDITSHVDFSAVDHALAATGFGFVGRATQTEFLVNLGIEEFRKGVNEQSLRRELSRAESEEEWVGIGALIDPDGLGRFRVVVHSRGLGDTGDRAGPDGRGGETGLTGLDGGSPLASETAVPLVKTSSAGHARLLRSGNPFGQPQIDSLPNWEQLFSEEP